MLASLADNKIMLSVDAHNYFVEIEDYIVERLFVINGGTYYVF